MATYKVAHLREQGQDMILVPVDGQFGLRSAEEQRRFAAYLQHCAASAGLAGRVVLAWQAGHERATFLGPPEWRAFFNSIDLGFVWANINRELTCR